MQQAGKYGTRKSSQYNKPVLISTYCIFMLFLPSCYSNNIGCHSHVGKITGKQNINYPQWCLDNYGSVLHEMLHALGFFHEQSRSDRDDYVTIMWENIMAGALYVVFFVCFLHHIPLWPVGSDRGLLMVGLRPLVAQLWFFIVTPLMSHVFSDDECEGG